MENTNHYDIALSYASEDKKYVDEIFNEIESRNAGIKIYKYDFGNLSKEWGTNLQDLLVNIYGNISTYTLMFVSKHYVKKFATTLEMTIANAQAASICRPYILPLKLDNTEIEDIEALIYLDSRTISKEEIVDALIRKLNSYRPNSRRTFVEMNHIFFSHKAWHKKAFKIDGIMVTVVVNQTRVKAFSELEKDANFYETGYFKYSNYQGIVEIDKKEWVVRIDIDKWLGKIKRIFLQRENKIYEYNS